MVRRASAFGLAAAVVASLALPGGAWAWGSTGHRLIGVVGAEELPPEIPAFLRTPQTVQAIGELAREPDRSKGVGDPHDADLNPGHFVDLDDAGTIAGGPTLASLPPTRAAYEAALHAKGTDGFSQGYLPYSLMEGWQQLAKDFAYWRVTDWAETHAKSKAEQAWMARDRRLREQLIIRGLGYWAHFVGDASQPLHVTVHYDGWGPFPNPEGFTTDRVHAAFEGAFVRANVTADDVRARLSPYQDCACSIAQMTARYLQSTLDQVEPFYALQKAGGFKDGDPRGRAFAAGRLAAGASELRDMVVDAWRASATLSVGYPPVLPADVESGKVDALGPLQGED